MSNTMFWNLKKKKKKQRYQKEKNERYESEGVMLG